MDKNRLNKLSNFEGAMGCTDDYPSLTSSRRHDEDHIQRGNEVPEPCHTQEARQNLDPAIPLAWQEAARAYSQAHSMPGGQPHTPYNAAIQSCVSHLLEQLQQVENQQHEM